MAGSVPRIAWWAPASRLLAVLAVSGLGIGLLGAAVLWPDFGGGYEFIAMGPPACLGQAFGCATDRIGFAWVLGGPVIAALASLVAGAVALARWAGGWPVGSRAAWGSWRIVVALLGVAGAAWITPVRGVAEVAASQRALAVAGVVVAGAVLALPAFLVASRHRRLAPGRARVSPAPVPRRPGW